MSGAGKNATTLNPFGRPLRAAYLAFLLFTSAAHAATAWTTAREVHLLDPARAALGEAVHLTGVVTALSGWKNSFFLQDASSGISVNRAPGGPELRPGDRVEVAGSTDPGAFAPMVKDARVTLLGHGALPPPHPVTAGDLAWGVQDSQWISLEGEVRSVERKSVWNRSIVVLLLKMRGPDLITVHVIDPDTAPAPSLRAARGVHARSTDWTSLVGATLRLRGVCGSIWNDRRQFSGIRLFVSSAADVEIKRPAPADPFDVPSRPIAGLLQYSRATGGDGQLKVEGTVSYIQPKLGFFLQDGSAGVFVHDKLAAVQSGTRIQAVGYPSMQDASPVLEATHVRSMGSSSLQPVRLADADQAIVVRDGFVVSPYDSMLVELNATLVESTPGTPQAALLLKSGSKVFRAVLPSGKVPGQWQRGSVLRVRGICDVEVNENHVPEDFILRLGSTSDVTVIKAAPWWSARHALWLCGALAAVAVGMLGWVAFLRRQARLRTLIWTDPLTGLYNRRAFLLFAEKHIEQLRRRKGALTLFYIDLDDFKQINDTRGHSAGDAALKDVAALLRQVFRESDVLCRLGGDEFGVLAHDAAPGAETIMKDRLNEALLYYNQRIAQGFRLSLSVGAVFCDADCLHRTIEELLEHADALMYGNKRRKQQERERLVPASAWQAIAPTSRT